MKTSRNLREGVSFLIAQWRIGLLNLGGGGRALKMMNDLGAPKRLPEMKNVEMVHSLVMRDRRRNLRDIASELGLSFGAVHSILTDILGMSEVSARWVPRMLTEDQERSKLNISKSLFFRYEDDPEDFMDRVVTQDNTWVHHFDPKSKSKACSGSTRAHPFLRNLREFFFFSREGDGLYVLVYSGSNHV